MVNHIVDAIVPLAVVAGGLAVRALLGVLFISALVAPLLLLVLGWEGATRLVDAATGLRRIGQLRWRAGCFYDRSHLWLRPLRNRVRVGLDDLAQRVMPDAEAITLPHAGLRVQKGDWLGEVRCASGAVALRAPIAGTVLSVNNHVIRRPGLLRLDPYRRAWLVDLQPVDRSYTSLPTAEHARAWLDAEDHKLTIYLERALGVAHADGGEFVRLPQQALTASQWKTLRDQFIGAA
jgi:glycine cleavage system H protein